MFVAADQHCLLYEGCFVVDSIRQYLLSIISAALVAGLILRLINIKTAHGTLIKIITGIFVLSTVIAPWAKLRLDDFLFYFDNIEADAEREVLKGEEASDAAVRSIIKEQVETYILEKASSMGTQLTITVSLSADNPPLPISIKIKGDASPYTKMKLKQIIENDIGIPEDRQIWT